MSKREIEAVGKILTDPENSSRTGEEVAELVIQALDDVRSRTHRLAVVGQIQYGPQEATHTVVLGPFSARGILDTPEKLQRATEGGCAARGVGQQLAWDSKTGTGRGRFMLTPAFFKPRDAWDFFRGPSKRDSEPTNLLTAPPAHIAEAVKRWEAGLWATEHHQTPRP